MLDIAWRISKLLAMAKNRAKTQGLPFNLDADYLLDLWNEQDGLCALTARPFDLERSSEFAVNPDSASLDKIVPARGYVRGNVRWITYHANVARSEYGDDRLMELARALINGVAV